jgi:hypothetical protein
MSRVNENGTRILLNLDKFASENTEPHPHDTALLKLWTVKFITTDT